MLSYKVMCEMKETIENLFKQDACVPNVYIYSDENPYIEETELCINLRYHTKLLPNDKNEFLTRLNILMEKYNFFNKHDFWAQAGIDINDIVAIYVKKPKKDDAK